MWSNSRDSSLYSFYCFYTQIYLSISLFLMLHSLLFVSVVRININYEKIHNSNIFSMLLCKYLYAMIHKHIQTYSNKYEQPNNKYNRQKRWRKIKHGVIQKVCVTKNIKHFKYIKQIGDCCWCVIQSVSRMAQAVTQHTKSLQQKI